MNLPPKIPAFADRKDAMVPDGWRMMLGIGPLRKCFFVSNRPVCHLPYSFSMPGEAWDVPHCDKCMLYAELLTCDLVKERAQ